MSECLHCDINELIRKHVEADENADVSKIAAMIVAALLLMPWIGQRLLDYAATIFSGGITF